MGAAARLAGVRRLTHAAAAVAHASGHGTRLYARVVSARVCHVVSTGLEGRCTPAPPPTDRHVVGRALRVYYNR